MNKIPGIILIVTGLAWTVGSHAQNNLDNIGIELNKLSAELDSVKRKLALLTNNSDTIKAGTISNMKILQDNLVPKGFKGQSMFEDKSGESAIFFPSGGIARFNYTDASFKTGYLHNITDRKLYLGGELTGKISDKKGALFRSGNLAPGVSVALNVGFREFSTSIFQNTNKKRMAEDKNSLIDGWLNFEVKYNYISYETIIPENDLNNQLMEDGFHGFSTLGKFNVKIKSSIIALASGWHKGNNLDDLDEVDLITRSEQADTANNRVVVIEESRKVKEGLFETKNLIPVNLDLFWYSPKQPRIAFYHFYRGEFEKNHYRSGIGTGFYLQRKGNPLNSIGGIVLELSNLQNMNKVNYLKDNFVINVIIGYAFGK